MLEIICKTARSFGTKIYLSFACVIPVIWSLNHEYVCKSIDCRDRLLCSLGLARANAFSLITSVPRGMLKSNAQRSYDRFLLSVIETHMKNLWKTSLTHAKIYVYIQLIPGHEARRGPLAWASGAVEPRLGDFVMLP